MKPDEITPECRKEGQGMSYKRRFEYMVQDQVGQVYGPYELEVKWTNATAAIYAAAEEFFPKAEGIGAQ